tara:strand:- start:1380 stop:1655 length:276 start_codon:yes stop_codon:yes gene_type:complete
MEIEKIIYIVIGIIMIVGYIPTFIDLIVYKKKAINTMSYVLWGIANGATCYYSFVILPDLLFQIMSSIHFLSCVSLIIINSLIKEEAKAPS